MIVSGNDSANVLAEGFGEILHKDSNAYKARPQNLDPEEYCAIFVKYMNDCAEEIGMDNTSYEKP